MQQYCYVEVIRSKIYETAGSFAWQTQWEMSIFNRPQMVKLYMLSILLIGCSSGLPVAVYKFAHDDITSLYIIFGPTVHKRITYFRVRILENNLDTFNISFSLILVPYIAR